MDEILGRSSSLKERLGTKGCGYIGKNVSYPGGKYEEMGRTFLDLVFPHCMLVLGKRGTGKSYTLGVIVEEFLKLEEEYLDNMAFLVVDTMSVFHSLKRKNNNETEIRKMKDFDISSIDLKNRVNIIVPEDVIDRSDDSVHHDHVLKIPLADVGIHEWLELFDLNITSSIGTMLSEVISQLKAEGNFSFDDIYRVIDEQRSEENEKKSLKSLFRMIDELNLFNIDGMECDFAEPGTVTVLDISYLGHVGKYELRNLIVSIFARQQMSKRTLYTTLEMQSQADLISDLPKQFEDRWPIIYMLIDEAHLFLPKDRETLSSGHLIDWIKLGRHPGLSLILATQEPSSLHDSAIRQSDIMIAHNMTSKDDLEALKKAKQSYMKKGLDEMVADMEYKRGLTIVFDDKTRNMQLCRIRPRHTLHTGVDASAVPMDER
ncbi:MAG: ATP-binding protein [Thermoplasmatota archaeon]